MRTLIIVALLASQTCFAQEYKTRFGIPGKKALELNQYEDDPSAGAVILYEEGNVRYLDRNDRWFDIEYTYHVKIKIFNKSAFDLAEVQIPYVDVTGDRKQKVENIDAFSYSLENGNMTYRRLKPSDIFTERVNDEVSVKKFAIPGVSEGSVIEYRFTKILPADYYTIPDWDFQWVDFPSVYSVYNLSIVPFFEYIYLLQGKNDFDFNEAKKSEKQRSWGVSTSSYASNTPNNKYHEIEITYVMKDLPAFRDESYITSVNDYIISLDLQLAKVHFPSRGTKEYLTSWPNLIETVLDMDFFGTFLKKAERHGKKIIRDFDLEALSNDEKAKFVISYVKDKYTWNGQSSKYTRFDFDDFFDQREGNSAEINLFLIGMLRAADISASPVLISTRSNGKIRENYPMESYFNYVIALVNTDNSFLTDATSSKLQWNRIPSRCINERGLVVEKDKTDWILLTNDILSIQNNTIQISPDIENGLSNIYLSQQNTEYHASSLKNRFDDDKEKLKEFFLKRLDNIDRLKTFNYTNNLFPYIVGLEGQKNLEVFEGRVVIDPYLELAFQENPFKLDKRNYPVDFVYTNSDQFDVTIAIPEGYKVYEVPEKYKVNDDLVSISADYQLTEEALKIKASYIFKKPVYQPEEYSKLKAHMDKIVEIFNQDVVLEEGKAMVSK